MKEDPYKAGLVRFCLIIEHDHDKKKKTVQFKNTHISDLLLSMVIRYL